jgi:DNA-binding HxlR family transcriptional regulator
MRRSYSQAKINRIVNTTSIVGDQYNLLIFFELTKFGEKSFNELKRMTQINAVTLTRKLRFLEKEKLIQKRYSGKEVIYSLTPKAGKLKAVIEGISSLIEKGDL